MLTRDSCKASLGLTMTTKYTKPLEKGLKTSGLNLEQVSATKTEVLEFSERWLSNWLNTTLKGISTDSKISQISS